MRLRLHRRGWGGRNWSVRDRRNGGPILYWVRFGAGGRDAQPGARRVSRGGLATPREPRRLGEGGRAGRRGHVAARGEGDHGEWARGGGARHPAALTELGTGGGRDESEREQKQRLLVCWCRAFCRVGETGREERSGASGRGDVSWAVIAADSRAAREICPPNRPCHGG